MKIYDLIVPIICVILGWLLNELSQRFRRNRKQKQAIAKALSELLKLGKM